jgi:proteasome activator subunit 4
LVKTIAHDFVIRLAEPSSEQCRTSCLIWLLLTEYVSAALKATVESEGLKAAAIDLEKLISVSEDVALLAEVASKAKGRIEQKNGAYNALVSGIFTKPLLLPQADHSSQLPMLLETARSPATHWRYALTATRFLRALVRRDQVRLRLQRRLEA